MVKAGKMMCQMMVKANCSRAMRTGSSSMRSTLERVHRSRLLSSLGGSGWPGPRGAGRVLCNLIVQPEIVMFLRPVVIDLAGPHRLERALQSERADIDVTEDQSDKQHGDHGVHRLRDLHSGDVGDVEREQQQIAGYRNRESRAKGAPEHQLFTGV